MLLQQCHPTRPGPSSLLEERNKTPIVFVALCVLSATPQNGGDGQGIYIIVITVFLLLFLLLAIPVGDAIMGLPCSLLFLLLLLLLLLLLFPPRLLSAPLSLDYRHS